MLYVAGAVVRCGAAWPVTTHAYPANTTYHLMLAAAVAAAIHLSQGQGAAAAGVCRATTFSQDTGVKKIRAASFSDISLA